MTVLDSQLTVDSEGGRERVGGRQLEQIPKHGWDNVGPSALLLSPDVYHPSALSSELSNSVPGTGKSLV